MLLSRMSQEQGHQEFRGYRPYADTDTDSDSESSGSHTSRESTGTSDDERITHDQRMEAMDAWRSAAQTWIAGTGRATVASTAGQLLRPLPLTAAVPPPGRRPAGAPRAGTVDLPIELRANDIKRHIINIDSQFRENPYTTSASDFWWHLTAPMRNVLRVRVASVELPNNYKFFTKERRFTTLSIIRGGISESFTIQNGNYSAGDMIDELITQFGESSVLDLSGITVEFSEITGKFTFCAPFVFSVDTATGGWVRPFNYGLGWFLGFSAGVHVATLQSSGKYCVVSDGCADFAGDNYLLLKVNDFDCVTHTINVYPPGLPAQENAITALAKLVLREPKNYMTFEDNGGQHTKEVVFQNPRDLLRFHVQLLDDFGDVVDMCTAQFSFSLEVIEVLNPSLFDAIRDSIMLRYV